MSVDLRAAILAALKQQGVSRKELARRMHAAEVCHHETVLRYLRGDHDTFGAVIEAMMEEVGLEVRPHRTR